MDKCKGKSGIVKMYLIKQDDIKSYEPSLKMKRKYGRFKREIHEINLKKQKHGKNN